MPLRLLGHKSTLSFKMNYSDLSSNQSEADSMTAQDSNQPPENDGPPPLPLDLHEHKLQIFLNWGFILLTSCIVPLVLYPSLHWGANLSIKICLCLQIFSYLCRMGWQLAVWNAALSVASAILGATTLFSLGMRTWRLFKPTSNCRPLKSESRWNVCFLFLFFICSLFPTNAKIEERSANTNFQFLLSII